METPNIKIETLAARYIKLKADIDKKNDELTIIKNEILKELKDSSDYVSKNYKITNIDTTRKNLQAKLVEEIFNITLTDKCYTTTNSKRFTVKDLKPITENYQPVDNVMNSLDDIKI